MFKLLLVRPQLSPLTKGRQNLKKSIGWWQRQAMALIGLRLIAPSCAASSTILARSSRSNCYSKPRTKKAALYASAPSAAAGVMMDLSRASAANRAGDRFLHQRVAIAGCTHDARQARHHAGIRACGGYGVWWENRRLSKDGRDLAQCKYSR